VALTLCAHPKKRAALHPGRQVRYQMQHSRCTLVTHLAPPRVTPPRVAVTVSPAVQQPCSSTHAHDPSFAAFTNPGASVAPVMRVSALSPMATLRAQQRPTASAPLAELLPPRPWWQGCKECAQAVPSSPEGSIHRDSMHLPPVKCMKSPPVAITTATMPCQATQGRAILQQPPPCLQAVPTCGVQGRDGNDAKTSASTHCS
jgi:hypothetical protein